MAEKESGQRSFEESRRSRCMRSYSFLLSIVIILIGSIVSLPYRMSQANTPSFRPVVSTDLQALKKIVSETDLFPSELLDDMISNYLQQQSETEYWLVDENCYSFAYIAHEKLTQGTYNILSIGVLPTYQSSGLGSALLKYTESFLLAKQVRLLIVDTSSTEEFTKARNFYLKNGYALEARIRDFWGPGDDKIIFRKALI